MVHNYGHYSNSNLNNLWHNNMERICIQWRNALGRRWILPRNSHIDTAHLVSDREPMHISLAIRFINFYRPILLPDNSTICLVTNKLLYEHKSSLSKNLKYLSNHFNLTVGEIICQTLSSIRHTCNRLWFNNILNKYVQSANIIRELIDVKEGYCVTIVSDYECDIAIQYLSTE